MAECSREVAACKGKPKQDDIPRLRICKDMGVGHVAVGVEVAAGYRVEEGSYV